MSDKPPLPPGVLPGITDTDPPPMDPSTIIGDGFVGAPPSCTDTPQVLYDGTTLTCTQGNWTGTPTAYAYQWQLDGSDVEGADSASLVPEVATGAATCIVTATNDYGSTAAPPSNAVPLVGTTRRRAARHAPEPEAEHDHPHANPEHPEHQSWLERMRRHPQQEHTGRHE